MGLPILQCGGKIDPKCPTYRLGSLPIPQGAKFFLCSDTYKLGALLDAS